jgi:hypothetical protein
MVSLRTRRKSLSAAVSWQGRSAGTSAGKRDPQVSTLENSLPLSRVPPGRLLD